MRLRVDDFGSVFAHTYRLVPPIVAGVLHRPVRQPVSDFLTPARPDQSAVFVGAEITRYQNGQPACPKGHGGRTT